jgi:hydroxyacylglutathione hydrolase
MDTHFTQPRPDMTIHQAEMFHTNTGILKTAEGFILVDPAFTQADFERIAAFTDPHPILAGFSTHAHYDHLFWSSLFGNETPRYCSEGTLGQITHHRKEIVDEFLALENDPYNVNQCIYNKHLALLSCFSTDLHYLNDISVAVVAIPGHLQGQTAFLFPDYQTLFAADTLSNTEPPSIEGSRQSLRDYLETLGTLGELIGQVAWIVPGHGDPADRSDAKARLEMDRRYLEALQNLKVDDFSNGLEALASEFILHIDEPRANSSDSWQIHLQNLQSACIWLN